MKCTVKGESGSWPKSSFFKSKELRDWRTWKSFVCCAVLYFFFPASCFVTFIDPEILGLYIRVYIYPYTACGLNHPHPQDVVVKTTDAGLLLLILYVLQLWWLKNTICPNSMVSKQQDLFHPWICIVDRAHQGQLVSALPIVTEGWGWNHLSGPLAWHLVWEDQKSWRWEQVGAAGPLFLWPPCSLSSSTRSLWAPTSRVKSRRACTLGKCRLGS